MSRILKYYFYFLNICNNHKLHETMMKIQIRDLMFSQFDGKRLICEIISTNVKYGTYSNMS